MPADLFVTSQREGGGGAEHADEARAGRRAGQDPRRRGDRPGAHLPPRRAGPARLHHLARARGLQQARQARAARGHPAHARAARAGATSPSRRTWRGGATSTRAPPSRCHTPTGEHDVHGGGGDHRLHLGPGRDLHGPAGLRQAVQGRPGRHLRGVRGGPVEARARCARRSPRSFGEKYDLYVLSNVELRKEALAPGQQRLPRHLRDGAGGGAAGAAGGHQHAARRGARPHPRDRPLARDRRRARPRACASSPARRPSSG